MIVAQRLLAYAPRERIHISAVGSALAHIIAILGIGFIMPRIHAPIMSPTLEITLVQTRSDRAPGNPDFLAQANQDGGGNSKNRDIARNPLPIREIGERRQPPRARPRPQPEVAGARAPEDYYTLPSPQKIPLKTVQPRRRDIRVRPEDLGLPTPDTGERAQLDAEISRFWQDYQKLPKRKYLNARTREYKYAAYMDGWRAKVERIGNLNYPEEARRRNLIGSLVLDVALNRDGGVHEISVSRSSGHKLLDDAARRIVELAAPFAPFPPEIRADVDILHITRTWKFEGASWTSKD